MNWPTPGPNPSTLAQRSARCQPRAGALTHYSRRDCGLASPADAENVLLYRELPDDFPARFAACCRFPSHHRDGKRQRASKRLRWLKLLDAFSVSMTMPLNSRKHKPANMLGDWDDVRF